MKRPRRDPTDNLTARPAGADSLQGRVQRETAAVSGECVIWGASGDVEASNLGSSDDSVCARMAMAERGLMRD
jgi:hypothetical protein